MLSEEILNKLPAQPDGAVEYFEQLGELDHHLLIYRVAYVKNVLTKKTEKMVAVKCTACGETSYMDYVSAEACCNRGYASSRFGFYNIETQEEIITGNELLCPCCGEAVKAVHIGSFSRNSYYVNNFDFVSVHLIERHIALLKWRFFLYYDKDGNRHIDIKKIEGNLFDKTKRYRVYGARPNIGGTMIYFNNWDTYCNFKDGIGEIESQYILPFRKEIVENSALPNCKLDKFVKNLDSCYPSIYLRLIQSYPNIENLVTNGASYLLHDFIEDAHEKPYYYQPTTFKIKQLKINLKGKRPSELMNLNKEEYKYFIAKKIELKAILFYVKHRACFKMEDISFIKGKDSYHLGLYESIAERLNVSCLKLMRYIAKQKRKNKNVDISFYQDYLKMKDYLEEPIDAFPSDIKWAHDGVLKRYNAERERIRKIEERERAERLKKEKEERKIKFKTRYEILSRFTYESEGLIIVPCKTEEELKKEGSTLNHCVYTYKESHANGRTAIFFIRHKEEPSKPYFTLELDEKKLEVRQNRGKCNCDRTEEVVIFEKHWLEYIKNVMKKEKQNGKSNRSKSKQPANA